MPSAIPDFATVRANPAYKDMSDDDIADSLYAKTHENYYHDMSAEEFKKALPLDKFKERIKFRRNYDPLSSVQTPELSWSETGRLAKGSLGKTASDIGHMVTHPGETADAMDAAFGRAAKQFGEHPIDTTWGALKGVAQGAKEGFRRGLVTTTGLIGSIPGAPLLEELPGGNPSALQQHIKEAKQNIATAPIGTAGDVAGIMPVTSVLGKGARVATGVSRAEQVLNEGLTSELAARRAQFGGTTLDVLPREHRERAYGYIRQLPKPEVAVVKDALNRRGSLLGRRHQGDVERAAGAQPGALLRPGEHTQGVAAQSRAIQDQVAENATRARDAAIRARNRARAANTEALTTERNKLYPEAFAKHADMPMDDFQEVMGTKIARDIVDTFGEADEAERALHGHGLGNLKILDKLEYQLNQDAEKMGIATVPGRARIELAQRIRDRLAQKFADDPEMAGYRDALTTHAQVANAPGPETIPSRRVLMPQPARDALARLVRNARSTEQFAKKGVAKRLRDESESDIRAAVPAHLQADIIQGGTNRERAFEELRTSFPEGVEPGAWNAFKRSVTNLLGVGGVVGGSAGAAALNYLDLPPGVGIGGAAVTGLLGLGAAAKRAHHRRIGKRILERTMDELPPPEPYTNVNVPPALLGRRNP